MIKAPNQNEYRIRSASSSNSGNYRCKGRMKSSQHQTTEWSDSVTLTVSDNKPRPVLTVSPSWLSPGASVTLNCEVEHPSAGWSFYWYKAVPDLSEESSSYELLPDGSGTAQDSYIIHGQTHTAGYVCRAGRGDPEYHTDHSQPKFVWSADVHSAASLTVSPDRVQHFTSDSVSLTCEGNFTEWRVRKFSEDGRLYSDCRRMTGSTCNINTSKSDTAVYWCESGSGEFSSAVNITVQNDGNGPILVSPVHPVTEGASVSLSCSLRTQKILSNVFFYHNDKLVQNDTRGELKISAVSKSDEGFYKCQYSGRESAQSWMSVKVTVSGADSSSSPVWLIVGLVCGVSLIIILLLLLYRCRQSKCKSLFFYLLQTLYHSKTQMHHEVQLKAKVSFYIFNKGAANEQTLNQDEDLQDLGLSSSLCSWILNFLSDRRQVVRLGSTTSSPITLNTGAPQGCVLSPLLYSLYTYDCTATNNSNIIVKFADDTTVVGLITNGDETAYREEVSALTHWCQDNHLTLNVAKTKELIVDFRRCRGVHTPITINGAAVERVSSFRFLGVHLAEDLTWSVHINKTVKKAQQRLFFLRRLKRFGMSPRILRTFYRCAIESILTGCITTWYGNTTAYNRKALQRVVRCAERIIGGELPSLQDIYRKRCLRKAGRIIKDSSHPSHKLFRLLPSGRRFCSIRSRTSRLRDSFFHQAIRLLNTS
uniref:Ig-like domain-containing protein n=1 Tax=Oreochromis niloticus TaxID=8128 RepID=A0A669C0V1_ORENI